MKKNNSYIKYILTTVINTSVNILTYFILLKLGVDVKIANGISIIVEIPVSFYLKNKYVFKNAENHVLIRFYKFILSRLLSMVVEFLGVIFLCLFLNEYLSKIIVQIFIFIMNYIISDKYVFKNHI